MATDLHSRIRSKLPEIADSLAKSFREELNANTHILDISYEALKVNVYTRKNLSPIELETYNKVYATLLDVVRNACSNKTFSSIDDPGFLPLFNGKKSVGAILIDGGPSNIFLVGKSYDAVQKFVSQYISRNPRLVATRFGSSTIYTQNVDSKGRILPDQYTKSTISKIDIGHTSSENNPNLISPLEKKIETVLSQAISSSNSRVEHLARNALKDLYNIQADISYQFKNTTPENINKTRKVLGEGYVVVTMHTRKLNNRFSKEEKRVYDKLLSEIALSLNLETVTGSNNIIQDAAAIITSNITGKKPRPHNIIKGSVTTGIKTNVKQKSSKLTLASVSKEYIKPNLSSLESLLRTRLAIQIRKNMGTGNAKNVLNYRTGRFANTATIDHITQSRAGMVSVFYDYMRYPYATFSEGGAQEYPKTRDPKLLISKSIREIGASLVSNRMRAVLV